MAKLGLPATQNVRRAFSQLASLGQEHGRDVAREYAMTDTNPARPDLPGFEFVAVGSFNPSRGVVNDTVVSNPRIQS